MKVLLSTAVRGVEAGILKDYKRLAAQKQKDTGEMVSINSLYVRALTEFICKPKNVKLINK